MPEQLMICETVDNIVALQNSLFESKTIEDRKQLGQFFTGASVSDYMASLVEKPNSRSVRILDAGAGAGILTASAAFRCLAVGVKAIHAVLYELDASAIPDLKLTMEKIQRIFQMRDAEFSFEISNKDFVLTRPDRDLNIQRFNIAVLNPPYFKYSVKSSLYAKAVEDLYPGDPNIYASFMAVALRCVEGNGQMISITPRSFTNGLYFKGFRNYLLTESSLDFIHIFKRRDKVFKNSSSSVLQENIICRFVKGRELDQITICSSDCDESIKSAEEEKYPVDLIIDPSNKQRIIRIPESISEADILRQAEVFEGTFESEGYFISTGPVVEHRTKSFITEDTGSNNSVPLYRSHNITPLTATWSGGHRKDVSFLLKDKHEKHTIQNQTCVLLKRFSSKDEKRRLVAAVYLAKEHGCENIGFGNKINYIGVTAGEFSIQEAYGVAAVLNSTFMDRYFRCVSGNTQVNATEIRVMRFPSRRQVKQIGESARKIKSYETAKIDLVVNEILGL
jgi:adenine-specific DNA-methyltransferase